MRLVALLVVVSFVAGCVSTGDSGDDFRIRSVLPVESELILER